MNTQEWAPPRHLPGASAVLLRGPQPTGNWNLLPVRAHEEGLQVGGAHRHVVASVGPAREEDAQLWGNGVACLHGLLAAGVPLGLMEVVVVEEVKGMNVEV